MKLSLEQFKDRMKELRKEEQGRNEGFEDYSKLCEGKNEGIEGDCSKLYEGETKLRWIWNKGTNLSKKTVVVGVVITTAPLVLPSLMALSVIGLAFSLPTWFGLATYACTDKLMDTLLPVPSPPSYVEDEYIVDNDDEVDEGDEEEDDDEEEDIGVREEEDEDDIIKEFETRIELEEEKDRALHMNVPEIVEEDAGEYMDVEKEYLDTIAIPSAMEGVEMPKDSLSTSVIEEEISVRRENDDEQLPDELLFVSARGVGKETENDGNFADVSYGEMTNETTRLLDEGQDGSRQHDSLEKGECKESEQNQGVTVKDIPQESGHNNLSVISEEVKPAGYVSENLAGIDDEELRNETVGLLEQIREEGRQQGSLEKEVCEENEENRGIAIKDMAQEKEIKNLPVIPEEVKSASNVRSENLNESVNERAEKGNEAEIALEEQSEILIERISVVNVETSDVHQGIVSDENLETLIISSVAAVEIDNGSGFDDQTAVPHRLSDLLHKGEELASSETVVDVSIDYQEVKIKSVPLSKHAETRIDQGSIVDSDHKELGSAEKLWEQIQNIRTIVGYPIAPHTSYLEELKALYVFTGVELPVSFKETHDIADATEKLHFLMSIVGVK